uniref:Uncharacterized protein n=1 Tax=Arundo donax TaxID=35708 RepID=A0A0A9GQ35_ARUDO
MLDTPGDLVPSILDMEAALKLALTCYTFSTCCFSVPSINLKSMDVFMIFAYRAFAYFGNTTNNVNHGFIVFVLVSTSIVQV